MRYLTRSKESGTNQAAVVTMEMVLGLRSSSQLRNLSGDLLLYTAVPCLLLHGCLKGRYTQVGVKGRLSRLRSTALLKQVKIKAEFKGYEPARGGLKKIGSSFLFLNLPSSSTNKLAVDVIIHQ